MMPLTRFLSDYGYGAVFVGSLFEGETILALAGFAAHQGYLSLPLTIAVAFAGGTLGDQMFFWIGRTWGHSLLARLPRAERKIERIEALLQRHHAPMIIGVRFMYGLRITGPIVIGACGVAPWRFALFNIIGAAIWAPLVAGLGYAFGQGLSLLLEDLQSAEIAALVVLIGSVGGFTLWRWRRARSRRDQGERR
jgi:membrane protein DedA with SNARE-associated domain